MSMGLFYQNVFCQSKMMKNFLLKENIIPKKHVSSLNLDIQAEEFRKSSKKVTKYESKGLPIVHHYKYVSELPVGHRFAMKKFHGILRYLRQDNVISMKQVVEPCPLDREKMSGVHTTDYLKRFFNGLTSDYEQRRTGFKWTPGLVERCQYETGGTLLAAQIALQKGLACSTGGGTHHAFPSYGSGFCLVNDLAIAASQLKEQRLAKKILIVDLDVHQGDGTAFIFQNDLDVFTLSMHCQNNFPLTKQKSDLDIELENFIEDSEYLAILKEHLPHVLNTFRPEFVFYDAGVDPHVNDELGYLNLSDQGLFDRDYYVLKLLASHGIPCATVVGGGYSTNREQLYIRHTIVHRAATKIWNENL